MSSEEPMDSAAQLREVRRKKILENMEKRLKKITALTSETGKDDNSANIFPGDSENKNHCDKAPKMPAAENSKTLGEKIREDIDGQDNTSTPEFCPVLSANDQEATKQQVPTAESSETLNVGELIREDIDGQDFLTPTSDFFPALSAKDQAASKEAERKIYKLIQNDDFHIFLLAVAVTVMVYFQLELYIYGNILCPLLTLELVKLPSKLKTPSPKPFILSAILLLRAPSRTLDISLHILFWVLHLTKDLCLYIFVFVLVNEIIASILN